MTDEGERLRESLDRQRNHVLGILEGLSEEQLRRPVLSSGGNCLGMVKHLALSNEHYWFRCIVGGDTLDVFLDEPLKDGGDWRAAPNESAESLFDLYRTEISRANNIIAATA